MYFCLYDLFQTLHALDRNNSCNLSSILSIAMTIYFLNRSKNTGWPTKKVTLYTSRVPLYENGMHPPPPPTLQKILRKKTALFSKMSIFLSQNVHFFPLKTANYSPIWEKNAHFERKKMLIFERGTDFFSGFCSAQTKK